MNINDRKYFAWCGEYLQKPAVCVMPGSGLKRNVCKKG